MNAGAGDALAQPLASRATEDPSAEPVRLLLSIRGEAGGAMRTRIASRREEHSVPPIGAVPLFDEGGTLPVGPFRRPRRSPMDEQRQRFRPEFWTCFYAAWLVARTHRWTLRQAGGPMGARRRVLDEWAGAPDDPLERSEALRAVASPWISSPRTLYSSRCTTRRWGGPVMRRDGRDTSSRGRMGCRQLRRYGVGACASL